MDNFNRSAGIIVKCGDEVLLCKRSEDQTYGGVWSIPSGHLNYGEEAIKAAHREFEEEMNLKASKNLKLISFIPMGKSLMYVYLMNVKEKIYPDLENAKDGFEHSECGWFTFDNIPEPINKKLKKVIEISFND
jgi:ADP-ribose pyrophosphatase YjhB (NUDIX family)